MPVEGTWVTACVDKTLFGQINTDIYSGYKITGKEDLWAGDTTCTGAPTTLGTWDSGTISVVGEKTAGWEGTPPGANPPTVQVTVVEYIGISEFNLMFVDDNVSPFVLYTGSETGPLDGNGYPTLLGTVRRAFIKQP